MKTIKLKRTITLTTVISLEVPEHLTEEDVVRTLDDECALFDVVDKHTGIFDARVEETEWDEFGGKAHVEFKFEELEDALKEDGLLE